MNIDEQVFLLFNHLAGRSGLRDQAMLYANSYGLYLFAGIVALFFFINRRLFWKLLLAIVLSRGLFTELIRFMYQRPRPFVNEHLEDVRQLIEKNASEASFPSGHAAFYFAVAFGVYFWNRQAGVMLVVLATILGLVRVYAGIHYPSDILGGAFIGLVSAWLVQRILKSVRN